jgi:hypothetical protein
MTYVISWIWQQPWRYRLNAARAFANHHWQTGITIALLLIGGYLLWEPVYNWTLNNQDKADRHAIHLMAVNKVDLTNWQTGYDDVKLEHAGSRDYWLLTYRSEKTSGYVDQQNRPVTIRCVDIYGVLAVSESGAYREPYPFILGLIPWWPTLAEYCSAPGSRHSDATPYNVEPADTETIRKILRNRKIGGN